MEGSCRRKPKIDYPCPWLFKVIGGDREAVRTAIAAVVGETPHTLVSANVSSGRRYHSFNLELLVESEADRDRLYRDLGACAVIKVVL
jgi:putative lipoic acid-binding regulatory protein